MIEGTTGAVTLGHTNHENARTRQQGLGQAGADVGGWMEGQGNSRPGSWRARPGSWRAYLRKGLGMNLKSRMKSEEAASRRYRSPCWAVSRAR